MLRSLLGLLALLFVTSGANSSELPEGVAIAKKNTWVICDELTITAQFRDKPTETATRLVPDTCAVAFQVGPTELVTAAHVPNLLQLKLLQYFAQQQLVYERHHGLVFTDRIPVGGMQVTFRHRLISAEGEVRLTPAEHLSLEWNNADPTGAAVKAFAAQMLAKAPKHLTVDTASASANIAYRDTDYDLALITLRQPVVRQQYVAVTDRHFMVHTLAWGINARKPGPFDEGRPSIMVTEASVREAHVVPAAKGWELGQGVWTYKLLTDQLNVSGNSGGPNVDAAGRLIGVTHAADSNEGVMAIFDIQPRCNVPYGPGRSLKFECKRFVIAGHFVYDFLMRARRAAGSRQ